MIGPRQMKKMHLGKESLIQMVEYQPLFNFVLFIAAG